MKKLFAMVLGAGLLLAQAYANDAKLGYVDLERILRESAPADRALKKLKKEFSGRDDELKKVADQMRARQTELDKGGLSIPETERRNKERELLKLQQDYSRMQREYREDLNARRNEELAGLQERVINTVKLIAQQEKFDVILQDALYFSPRVDITDKVLKALADK